MEWLFIFNALGLPYAIPMQILFSLSPILVILLVPSLENLLRKFIMTIFSSTTF